MTEDGNGSDNGGQVVEQLPTLCVGSDRLSFVAGDRVAHIKLEDLVNDAIAEDGPGRGPVPLLLFGIVLKLADVDHSLRRALQLTEGQVERSQQFGSDPSKLIKQVVASLREIGMKIPDVGPKT